MVIEVNNRTEELIQQQLDSGAYTSAEEVVEAAIESLSNGHTAEAAGQVDDHPATGESFLEAAKRVGMIGCFEGPSDLSTNPKHMEGFGQP